MSQYMTNFLVKKLVQFKIVDGAMGHLLFYLLQMALM